MVRPRLNEAMIWRYVSRRVPSLTAAVVVGASASVSLAAPQVNNVAAGEVSVSQQGHTTLITASHNSIINYNQFNIAANETVRFIQPSSTSRVLNRDLSGTPSQINGQLLANGQVYLINRAGIFFGTQAIVNVGGIHAAAGNIADQDFLAGTDRFTSLAGTVSQSGTIIADEVSLLGRRVENFGTIVAPQGTITMAAGDSVYITRHGSYVMAKIDTASLDPEVHDVSVVNQGRLEAPGGTINMGAGDVFAFAVKQRGIAHAQMLEIASDADASWSEAEVARLDELTDNGPLVITDDGPIDIETDRDVIIASASDDISVQTTGGRVIVDAASGIEGLDIVVSAEAGMIFIDANGGIVDADGSTDLMADFVTLIADAIGTVGQPLQTEAGALAARTEVGGLYLANTGSVRVVNDTAYGVVGMSSTGDLVFTNSGGRVDVPSQLVAAGDLSVGVAGNETLSISGSVMAQGVDISAYTLDFNGSIDAGGPVNIDVIDILGLYGSLRSNGSDVMLSGRYLFSLSGGLIDASGLESDGDVFMSFTGFAGPPRTIGHDVTVVSGGTGSLTYSITASGYLDVDLDMSEMWIRGTLHAAEGMELTTPGLIRIQKSLLADNGSILLESGRIRLVGGSTITASTVELAPLGGVTVGLGDASEGATYSISQILLDQIHADTLRVGSDQAGTIYLGRIDLTGTSELVLQTGADIHSTADPLVGEGSGYGYANLYDGEAETVDELYPNQILGIDALTLIASTGVGSGQMPLSVAVESLTVSTETGGIYLRNQGDLYDLNLDAGYSEVDLTVLGRILDDDEAVDLAGSAVRVQVDESSLLQLDTETLVFNGNEEDPTSDEGVNVVEGDLESFSYSSYIHEAYVEASGDVTGLDLSVPHATIYAGGSILDSVIKATGQIVMIAGIDIRDVHATSGTSIYADAGGVIESSSFTAGQLVDLRAASIGHSQDRVLVSAPMLTGDARTGSAYLTGPSGSSAAISLAFAAAQTMSATVEGDIVQVGDWEAGTIDLYSNGDIRINGNVTAISDETILLHAVGTVHMTGTGVLDTTLANADIVIRSADLDLLPGARMFAGLGDIICAPLEGTMMFLGDTSVLGEAETAPMFAVSQEELDMMASATTIIMGSETAGPILIEQADLGERETNLTLHSASWIDEAVDNDTVKVRTNGLLAMVAGDEIGRDPEDIESSAYDALDFQASHLDVYVTAPGKVSLRGEGEVSVDRIYTTSGDIYLDTTDSIVAMDIEAHSDVDLSSQTGSIAVGRISASEGVNLTARQGGISVASGAPVHGIIAPTTSMSARSVGSASAPITTQVGSMSVTTSGGNMSLSQQGNLSSINLNAGTAGNISFASTGSVASGTVRGNSATLSAESFGSGQNMQLSVRDVSMNASGDINMRADGRLRRADVTTADGSVHVWTSSPSAQINVTGAAAEIVQPRNESSDIPDEAAADEPETPIIDIDEPLWVVSEFQEQQGWLDQHALLRDLEEQWGSRIAFLIEQALRDRGERTAGVSDEISDAEIESLVAQGLEYFCQGVLERLELEQDAAGEPIAKLTLVYELQKNVSSHMTLVQKKRIRTRDESQPQITPDDLNDLLEIAAQRIVERMIDDAPTGMMGVRG